MNHDCYDHLEAVMTCEDAPLAYRCKACNRIFVTEIKRAVYIRTCRYRPCSKVFETPKHTVFYHSRECQQKAAPLLASQAKRKRENMPMMSYFVEVWRPRVGEKAGDVANRRPLDPDHSFFVSAVDSERARIEVGKNEWIKKGDTYRMTPQAMEQGNKSGGLVVTGRVK